MTTLGPMSSEQARRAMLSLSIKALFRPNEPVSPAEVVLYEMIYAASGRTRASPAALPASARNY